MNYLTTRQVAERLAVDPGKVTEWIRSGQLPAIDVSARPGGKARYRVSEEELQCFIDRRSQAKAPAKARRRRSKIKQVYTTW